jgi:hypothetical protein
MLSSSEDPMVAMPHMISMNRFGTQSATTRSIRLRASWIPIRYAAFENTWPWFPHARP